MKISISRHKTAISRSGLSRPIRLAIESGLITTERTVFDYGCSHGDDLRRLQKRGIQSFGWDPVYRPNGESRKAVVVSRQVLIDSRFSTVICAPIYSTYHGLPTQVPVGIDEGLKHDSSIHCDELISIPKSSLTNYVGRLAPEKIRELDQALAVTLELSPIS